MVGPPFSLNAEERLFYCPAEGPMYPLIVAPARKHEVPSVVEVLHDLSTDDDRSR